MRTFGLLCIHPPVAQIHKRRRGLDRTVLHQDRGLRELEGCVVGLRQQRFGALFALQLAELDKSDDVAGQPIFVIGAAREILPARRITPSYICFAPNSSS